MVVPAAEAFQLLRPDRQHPHRLVQFLGQEIIDSGKLEYRVALEWLFEETLGHGRGAEQQGAHVQSHQGGRQQARRREYGVTSSNMIGGRQHVGVVVALRLEQRGQLARRGGHGGEQVVQPRRTEAVVFGRLAPEDAQGDGRLHRRGGTADGDDRPALFAPLRIDAGDLNEVEQFLQGVVVETVAVEIEAQRAEPGFDRQFIVVGALERLEKGAGAELGAADAEQDDAVGPFAQPVGEGERFAEVAGLAPTAILVEQRLRQIDEAGFERQHFRRGVAHLPFRRHLAADLHQPRRELLEPARRQEMPCAQLGRRRPVLGDRR